MNTMFDIILEGVRSTASHRLVASAEQTDEEKLHLPPGRTLKEAIAVAKKHRELIWNGAAGKGLNEDQKIDLLVKTCTSMCCDDTHSGRQLAQMAVWS